MDNNTAAALDISLENFKIDAKRLGKSLEHNEPAALMRIIEAGWSGPDLPSHAQLLDLVAREQGYKHFHELRQRITLPTAAVSDAILWRRYRAFVSSATPLFSEKADALAPELLIEQRGDLSVFYAPFEHVHPMARVVIVGLTPGFTQASAALSAARAALADGVDDVEVLQRAKETGAFAGAIRKNLVKLLAAVDIDSVTGCAVDELFDTRRELIHTTSAVRYPIFLRGENYNGSVVDDDFLRPFVEKYLGEELGSLQAPVIALGKHAAAAVELLVSEGRLDAKRYLGQLPHPSGANAGRVAEALTASPAASTYARMVDDMRTRIHALAGKPIAKPIDETVASFLPALGVRRTRIATPPIVDQALPILERVAKPERAPGVSSQTFEQQLTALFLGAGFHRTHETSKKIEFTLSGRQLVVYLDRTKLAARAIQVVVPPTFPTEPIAGIDGLDVVPGYFHSSNMRAFPRHMHRGVNPIPYGRAVRVSGESALGRLLTKLVELAR